VQSPIHQTPKKFYRPVKERRQKNDSDRHQSSLKKRSRLEMTGRKLTFEEDIMFDTQDDLQVFTDHANVDHLTRFTTQQSHSTNPFQLIQCQRSSQQEETKV